MNFKEFGQGELGIWIWVALSNKFLQGKLFGGGIHR